MRQLTWLRLHAIKHALTITPESLFQALSDATRLLIICLLATSEPEIYLRELLDALLELQCNLSRHLKVLRQTSFLSSQKEGRWIYHRLTTAPDYYSSSMLWYAHCLTRKVFTAGNMANLNKHMAVRENDRCWVGILSGELKAGVEKWSARAVMLSP